MSALRYGLDEVNDGESGESWSAYEAADAWASHGKDADYTFGYSEAGRDNALRS